MSIMARKEIKAPTNFKEVKELIEEYNYMQELIKKAEDGKKMLLGFISTSTSDNLGLHKSEIIDYTWGQVFANCLKERCKLIENLISKNI